MTTQGKKPIRHSVKERTRIMNMVADKHGVGVKDDKIAALKKQIRALKREAKQASKDWLDLFADAKKRDIERHEVRAERDKAKNEILDLKSTCAMHEDRSIKAQGEVMHLKTKINLLTEELACMEEAALQMGVALQAIGAGVVKGKHKAVMVGAIVALVSDSVGIDDMVLRLAWKP